MGSLDYNLELDGTAVRFPPALVRRGMATMGATLALLFGSLLGIGALLTWHDVYGLTGNQQGRIALDKFPVADHVLMKAAHAIAAPRYPVGLFGNSRAVEVSHDDINLPAGAFFNFAVGGTPFRQSVALLEHLAASDKSPTVAIISIDNHDIGFGGLIYWAPVSLLIRRALAPVPFREHDGERSTFWRSAFVNLRDVLSIARDEARSYLNAIRVTERIAFLTGTRDRSTPPYLSDGSRPVTVSEDRSVLSINQTGFAPSYQRLIETDLERLAAIEKAGTKIIIYESPMHPKVRAQVDASRPDAVRAFRNWFRATCDRLSLTCVSAPALDEPLPWSDCCHAPPRLLGRFIAGLL